MINYQDRRPIYEQIVERFQTLILSGVLEADSQMPSVRALATELSINPNTIQKAFAILEQEGYIYPVKGRGNFVSGNANLVQKKKEEFFCEMMELLKKGQCLNITKEECVQAITEFFKEDTL